MARSPEGTIIRLDTVSFEYGAKKPILREVSFSLRRGAKSALMGQNGSGKNLVVRMIYTGTRFGTPVLEYRYVSSIFIFGYFSIAFTKCIKKHISIGNGKFCKIR